MAEVTTEVVVEYTFKLLDPEVRLLASLCEMELGNGSTPEENKTLDNIYTAIHCSLRRP